MNSSIVLDRPEQIAAYRVSLIIKNLEMEIRHGLSLTRHAPRIKDLRAYYGINARTKAQALDEMVCLQAQIEEGTAYYEIRDGVCHYRITEGVTS